MVYLVYDFTSYYIISIGTDRHPCLPTSPPSQIDSVLAQYFIQGHSLWLIPSCPLCILCILLTVIDTYIRTTCKTEPSYFPLFQHPKCIYPTFPSRQTTHLWNNVIQRHFSWATSNIGHGLLLGSWIFPDIDLSAGLHWEVSAQPCSINRTTFHRPPLSFNGVSCVEIHLLLNDPTMNRWYADAWPASLLMVLYL